MCKQFCQTCQSGDCLLSFIDSILLLLDEDYNICYFTPSFKQVFVCEGDSLDQNSSKSFLDFVFPEDVALVQESLECALNMPGDKVVVQYRALNHKKKMVYCEMIIKNRLNDANCSFLLLDIRDISDRVYLNCKLEEQSSRWQVVFDKSKDGMLIVNDQGYFEEVNPVVCGKLGYSVEEILKKNVLDIVAPEYRERAKQRLSWELPESNDFFESLYIKKNGDLLPVELSCSHIYFLGKNCLLAVVRDISGRKKLEKETMELQKQFVQSQKMETVGRLSSGMAHDFNNLLTVLINNFSLLETAVISELDPLHGPVQDCQLALEQAANLTKQLLSFSRPSLSDELETINLKSLLKSMYSMLRRLLPENIQLRLTLSDDDLFVKINKGNMEQIIVNLIVNARDAINGVGEIFLILQSKEDKVVLSVKDTGCGIPVDLQDKIFEPFFSTKGSNGTGLGLFMVAGLLYKVGAKINLLSAAGQGSTFDLVFPQEKWERSADSPCAGAIEFTQRSATILVVEDDPLVNSLAVRLIQRSAYKVVSVKSAEAALLFFDRLADKQSIDLVFTDITMSGLTGIQLAKQLKDRKLVSRVLLTSGYISSKDSLADIVENEVDWKIDFIAKPYKSKDLVNKIKNLLA